MKEEECNTAYIFLYLCYNPNLKKPANLVMSLPCFVKDPLKAFLLQGSVSDCLLNVLDW